ncbi:MAG TPA: hypothetical protein VFK78_07340 [Gemmatimonadales bacterium]|nr:hypothetical protein [Gemmatimonadales bacterium]
MNEPTTGRKDGKGMSRGAAALLLATLSAWLPARLAAQTGDTVPAGYGTLKRDDIVVRFSTGQLEIQVLPLDEQVIRLLAPDTYKSLRRLIDQRQAQIDTLAERAGVTNPTLVMVTFYGLIPQARFTPEDLDITSRGQLFRPDGILALSPTWNAQQLDARQQAVAIYLFDPGITFREALTVSYEGLTNDSWTNALRTLDQERARVGARARSKPNP